MCRFYGFHANEPTKVECTLVYAQNALLVQSMGDQTGQVHPDGWGVGFYHDGQPDVERSTSPAFKDAHFSVTAERVYAHTVIAHIRHATVGGPSLVNTHPFAYGRWLFAHNGTVSGFQQVASRLQRETDPALLAARKGTTDSEQVFLWLLTRLGEAGIDLHNPADDAATMGGVVGESLRNLAGMCGEADRDDPPTLNFLLSNGVVLVATRWNHSLYCVSRRGVHDCEICGIPHVEHSKQTDYRAVVLASEPISQEDWQEVPDRSVVTVDANVHTVVHPLSRIGSRV